jgi:hypothetical protein
MMEVRKEIEINKLNHKGPLRKSCNINFIRCMLENPLQDSICLIVLQITKRITR